jgi:adsorption protein B
MSWHVADAVVRTLALPVAGGVFLNQLDELFVDANYLLRGLGRRQRQRVSYHALAKVEQKSIAILVPAWHESDVIRRMLEHNLATLDYSRGRYDIFCGTYRNDADTQREVDAVARRSANVHKVVVPNDGPTSKADCLNWVYQGISLHEQKRGRRFDILLMHDAEDVIHPLSLRLYSLLIPPNDFVQTPVFSLPIGLHQVVGATYIDEFAEHHLKDMPVREAIGGLVPSAGVGSAFDREAFGEIARSNDERPFNVESLTEDYEIGLKFRLAGKRVHFACRTLDVRAQDASQGSVAREEIIATREYFPGGFHASVRQRSRWILGITLQTWRQIGWQGPLPVLYCLWRDRKALFTNVLVLAAYLVLAYGGLRFAGAAANVLPPVDASSTSARLLRGLFAINLCALGWRGLVKARLVGRLYGFGHALLSAPRVVLGNLVGLFATGRAVSMWVRHRLNGAPLRWLKTEHAFPSVEVLRAQRQRLGEILMEQHGLSPAELAEALELQQELGRPLGHVLSLMGVVPDRVVTRALAQLHEMVDADLDEAAMTAPPARLLVQLPEAEAERLGVVPLAAPPGGAVRVGADGPLPPETLRTLEERFAAPVEIALAPPGDVRRARHRVYRGLLVGAATSEPLAAPSAQGFNDEDIDAGAVVALGPGFCAFYGLLPLRPADPLDAKQARRIAAAHPVHPRVLGRLQARLGAAVQLVGSRALDIDVALATLEGPGDDAVAQALRALEALADEGDRGGGEAQLRGAYDVIAAAHTRAELLGLPVVAADVGLLSWPLLPPDLHGADPVYIRALGPRTLVLATPRPSPRLHRAVATLYPTWAVAWEVALPDLAPREEASWNVQMFEAMSTATVTPEAAPVSREDDKPRPN